MNQSLISSYVEYLRKMGYSAKTIHVYSKALEQAPDTWNTNVPGVKRKASRVGGKAHMPSEGQLHPKYIIQAMALK